MSKLVRLEQFGKAFIPNTIRPRLRRYLFRAGYPEVPFKLYGGLFIFSIVLTAILVMVFIYPLIKDQNQFAFMTLIFIFWVIIQSLMLLLMIMVLYIKYDIDIYRRTMEMEEVLEEYLRYVSENLKGGMTFDQALWNAIRPQYGTLSYEMNLVAKKVMTGTDISDALIEFTEKYESPTLRRSFQLIVEGMKGGGNIAYIIDRVEKDIRETKELKEEMVSANTTYVIFMTAIVLVIAPALFGLSHNLLIVLQKIAGLVSSSGSSDVALGMMDFSKLSIDPDSFKWFAIGALLVISLFASMILAILQKGSIKGGIKYIPVFMLVSIVMYLFFKALLGVLFSGIVMG